MLGKYASKLNSLTNQERELFVKIKTCYKNKSLKHDSILYFSKATINN